MTARLRLTDAGRNAILDAANVGTQAVQIRKLALGDGSGPGGGADDGRTTLRDQRDIAAIVGSAAVDGQIAVRAEINTATAYAVTEMGLFARIGDAGNEFLFAYWTDDGTVFINKPASVALIVAASIGIVRSAAAVNVTVAPNLTVGAISTLLDLTDGPNSYVNAARRKFAVKADGTGFEFVEGLLPHEVASDAEVRAGVLDTKAVTPVRLAAALRRLVDAAPAALDTLNELAAALGDDPNFAATVNAAIAARARLDGATFTGRTRGLTRPAGDNGTDFATTAFVARATAGSGLYMPETGIYYWPFTSTSAKLKLRASGGAGGNAYLTSLVATAADDSTATIGGVTYTAGGGGAGQGGARNAGGAGGQGGTGSTAGDAGEAGAGTNAGGAGGGSGAGGAGGPGDDGVSGRGAGGGGGQGGLREANINGLSLGSIIEVTIGDPGTLGTRSDHFGVPGFAFLEVA